MSLEACYAQLGGDLETARARLMTDERIEKFIGFFAVDPSFDNLQAALDEGNMQEAFRAVHTLKGNSINMGFAPLADVAVELADVLRPNEEGVPAGPLDRVPELLDRLEVAYTNTIDAFSLI